MDKFNKQRKKFLDHKGAHVRKKEFKSLDSLSAVLLIKLDCLDSLSGINTSLSTKFVTEFGQRRLKMFT